MECTVERWPFDEVNYPGIDKLLPKTKRFFALKHILMYQTKALGKATEAIEPADHGLLADENALRLAIQKFFVNTLRLADASGMSTDDLVGLLRDRAGGKS